MLKKGSIYIKGTSHSFLRFCTQIQMAQLISFAELTRGTETVCCTTIAGKTYMSICDITMVVCKKDNDKAGRVWRDLKNGVCKVDLLSCTMCQDKLVHLMVSLYGLISTSLYMG